MKNLTSEQVQKNVDEIYAQTKSKEAVQSYLNSLSSVETESKPTSASFFDAARASSLTSIEDFADAMGETTPFPAPADVSKENPLKVTGRTVGNTPYSGLKFVGGIIDFIGNAVAHPINTAESLIKDPSQIFGPAARELAYGLYNTAEAAVKGDGKALDELYKGLSKAFIAFQDDPIMSFFGPKFGKDMIKGMYKKSKDVVEVGTDVATRTADATREAGAGTGAQVFKREMQNIGEEVVMNNPITNFFRSVGDIYHKANQGWVMTQARNTVNTAFDLMNKQKALESEVGFLSQNEAKLSEARTKYEQQLIDAESKGTLTDKKKAELQTKIDEINTGALDLQNKRAQLSEMKAETDKRMTQLDTLAQDASARSEVDLNTKTYRNPEEFNNGFSQFISESKRGADLIYETTLKDANGKEIPVSPSQLVPKLVNFAETIKKTGDLELYKKYNKIAAG
jgi:hypothetical protein